MQSIFGLDIGDRSIKVVEGRIQGGVFSITSMGESPLPEGAIRNWEVRDEDALAETIKELMRNAKPRAIRSRLAVVSVPEPKVFLHYMDVPKTQPEKLAEVVKWELAANISDDMSNMYWDWEISEQKSGPGKVLAAAASKEILGKYEEVLAKIGVKVVAFDMESKALARAMRQQLPPEGGTLIADVSARRTSLSVFSRGLITFTSGLMVGGDTCTEQIAEAEGISEDKAEQVKHKMDLGNPQDGTAAHVVVCPMMDNIAAEIRRTIEFYGSKNRDQAGIDKVILAGGAAQMKGIEKYLQNKLSVKVKQANYSQNLDKKSLSLLEGKTLIYGTAIGLAIRAAGSAPITGELNIISQDIQEEAAGRGIRQMVSWFTVVTLTIAFLLLASYGALFGYLYWDTNRLEQQIESQSLEKLPQQLELEQNINKVNTYLDTIERITAKQHRWSEVIEDIKQASVEGVAINRLTLSEDAPGRIIGTASNRSEIVVFLEKLSAVDGISNVENPLSNFSTGEKELIDYEITFNLDK